MRKRSSKGGGAQRSIQVHLMVNEEEAAMIRAAARKRNQTVSLTIIEAVKLLEGSLYVEEEEHDSPTVQALREIRQRADRRTGQQEAEQRQIDPWLVVFLPFRCCSRRVAPFYKNLLISFRLPRKQLAVGESRH